MIEKPVRALSILGLRPGIKVMNNPNKIAISDAENKAGLSIPSLFISRNYNLRAPFLFLRAFSQKAQMNVVRYMNTVTKVLMDKVWYSLFNSSTLFQHVERTYREESYYTSLYKLLWNEPVNIIDGLYLGNAFNAADYEWLKENKIKVIVNATSCVSNYFEKAKDIDGIDEFEYHRYETEDLNSGSLSEHYESFCQVVEETRVRNGGERMLVHCFAGKSRSAALVLYYLSKRLHEHSFNTDNTLRIVDDGFVLVGGGRVGGCGGVELNRQLDVEEIVTSSLGYLKTKCSNININTVFVEEIKVKLRDVFEESDKVKIENA